MMIKSTTLASFLAAALLYTPAYATKGSRTRQSPQGMVEGQAGAAQRTATQRRLTASAKSKRTLVPTKKLKGNGRPVSLLPVQELVTELFGAQKADAQASDWLPIPETVVTDANGKITSWKGGGWVYEAEAKFQVPATTMASIQTAMEQNDLERFVGPKLGADFRAKGYRLVKQVAGTTTQDYKDVYLDTADYRGTKQGISIRFRQVGSQIGTNNGMVEIKIYTKGAKNTAVQDRLEIRFRTDDVYTAQRLFDRDPALEAYNPLAKLDQFDPGFKGKAQSPVVNLNNQRLEYQLRDANDKPLYLFTLDTVNGSSPRSTKAGTAKHHEFEVEQMFTDAGPEAAAMLRDITQKIEDSFSLPRSTFNKPGQAAKNLGLI